METDDVVQIEETKEKFGGFDSVEQFVENGFKTLIEATKSSNKLPSGKSRDFYEACPSFHRIMKDQGQTVLTQLSRVLKHAGCKGNIQRRDNDEKIEMIVDANDTIFERVGILLDEIAGIRRHPDAELLAKASKHVSGAWNRRSLSSRTPQKISEAVTSMWQASRTLEKPQLKFAEKVDNDRNTPFVPKIKFKYNILKPLSVLFEHDETGCGRYSHPYEFEIEKFAPGDDMLGEVEQVMYSPLESTPFLHVTKPEQVEEMLRELRKAKEIAIDLEHHSYRSFQGFTCLMQISTRGMDFIVDTISLREDLQPLNEVFTDPKILKVFHGAHSDIQWLQKDLGLYIVNMFDTHIAAKHLNYSALSLAYLLNRFCDVQAQKQYQLADWRVRPLPEEMMQYAREDTHYLLYISDVMRNALLRKANGMANLLRAVYTESNLLCLTRYEKPLWHPEDHLNLYHKSKRLFDNRQLSALERLYDWRDQTARENDDSPGYVLPNHMLLHLAETLPREVQGILACCNPIPPLVRQNLTQLHYIIRGARQQPLIRPIIEAERQVDRSEGISVDSPLRCPHDLSWMAEFRPDLPVLLDKDDRLLPESCSLHLGKPVVTVFETVKSTAKKVNGLRPLTPYQRYKMVKPFADSIASNVTELEVKKEVEVVGEKVQNTIQQEPEFIDETKPLRKQFTVQEIKGKSEPKKEEAVKRKRKFDEEDNEEDSFADIISAQPEVELLADRVPSVTAPNHQVKKRKKMKCIEVADSFDYSTVDYKQFQSNPVHKVVHNDQKRRIKQKRSKKKIKVSI